MLLFVVSGAHVDGVLVALLLGAFVAAGQRRWAAAVVLACLAAGHQAGRARRGRCRDRRACRRGPALHRLAHRRTRRTRIALPVLAACTLVVPYGLGWAGNFSSLTREHTPFAPASLVSDLISTVVSAASFDDLAVGGRVAAPSPAHHRCRPIC